MNAKIVNNLPIFLLALAIILSAGYWFGLASDKFESTAVVSIQQSNDVVQAGGHLSSLLGMSSTSNNDAKLAKEYMLSRDMLYNLSESISLIEHYSSDSIDPVSRLNPKHSYEDFTEYMTRHLSVHFDETSSVLNINATAFDAETSRKLVSFLILESELFLNNINRKLAISQVDFASDQLDQTKNQVKEAMVTLLDFQNKNGVVSPIKETEIISSIVASMETELANKKAELSTISSYLQHDAPEVKLLKSQIASLTRQMKIEKQKILGVQGRPLNKLNARYQELETELSFRKDAYQSTLAALETARLEASRKLKHLVVIEAPTLPDEAQYPKRLYNFVTYALIALLLYWISKLTIATIRDHKD